MPRKNFLKGSMTCLRYLHTSLGPYLHAETNGMVIRRLVRFLSRQTWAVSGFLVVQSGSESILLRLLQNSSILRKRQQNLVNALTLSCSKKFSRGLHNISAVLAYVFRINPIHRNKNYDHPTHITIFIVRNVSRVRFFGGSERIRANLNHFWSNRLKTHQKRTKVWWTLWL